MKQIMSCLNLMYIALLRFYCFVLFYVWLQISFKNEEEEEESENACFKRRGLL